MKIYQNDVFRLNDKITGTFNAVSPKPVSNHIFSITLAKATKVFITTKRAKFCIKNYIWRNVDNDFKQLRYF